MKSELKGIGFSVSNEGIDGPAQAFIGTQNHCGSPPSIANNLGLTLLTNHPPEDSNYRSGPSSSILANYSALRVRKCFDSQVQLFTCFDQNTADTACQTTREEKPRINSRLWQTVQKWTVCKLANLHGRATKGGNLDEFTQKFVDFSTDATAILGCITLQNPWMKTKSSYFSTHITE